MNKHILIAMDWKNKSKEELEKNYTAAYSAAAASYSAADADADADAAEHWVNKYFVETGEDRKEYEKALKEIKK